MTPNPMKNLKLLLLHKEEEEALEGKYNSLHAMNMDIIKDIFERILKIRRIIKVMKGMNEAHVTKENEKSKKNLKNKGPKYFYC